MSCLQFVKILTQAIRVMAHAQTLTLLNELVVFLCSAEAPLCSTQTRLCSVKQSHYDVPFNDLFKKCS